MNIFWTEDPARFFDYSSLYCNCTKLSDHFRCGCWVVTVDCAAVIALVFALVVIALVIGVVVRKRRLA